MMARHALLLLLAAGCASRYRVNEVAQNVPNVFLRGVRASGGSTKLSLLVEADQPCASGVGAFALHAGGATMKLTFEALPEGVREFEVEGAIEGIGPVAFAVNLDHRNVVSCP